MNVEYTKNEEYLYVNDNDRKAGHIIAPPGYGKTTDEKVSLDKAFKSNATIRLGCMTSHRLLLTEQNGTEVMEAYAVQEGIFTPENTIVISNSSANEDNYKEDFKKAIPGKVFNVLTMDEAFVDGKIMYNYKKFYNTLVASCYPSMRKYFNFRDVLTENCNKEGLSIISSDVYDETHKIVLIESKERIGDDIDDDSNRYYVDMKRASKSNYLTGLTATPDSDVTEAFAKINDDYRKAKGLSPLSETIESDDTVLVNTRKYIKYVSTRKSIEMGRTLPSRFHTSNLNEGVYKEPDRLALYILAMAKMVDSSNGVFHEMVTLSKMEQVKRVAEALYNNHGVTVFSTTSEGRYITEGDKLVWYEPKELNLLKFKERVESTNGPYIILQCEQLNEGLNITGINLIHEFVRTTSYAAKGSTDEAKHTQRTGRANRVLSGEFGVPYDKKTKKVGNVIVSHVYNSSEDFDYETFKDNVRNYSKRVYGTDIIEIITPSKMPSSGIPSADLQNIMERLKAMGSQGSTPNRNGRRDKENGGKTVYNYGWTSLEPLLYNVYDIVRGWLGLESLMKIESFRKDYSDRLVSTILKAVDNGQGTLNIEDSRFTSDEILMSRKVIVKDLYKMLESEKQTKEVEMAKLLLSSYM